MARPGIYGMIVDGSSGRELDRVGGVFGCEREPASVFGFRLPWGQRDETYRARIWASVLRRWHSLGLYEPVDGS